VATLIACEAVVNNLEVQYFDRLSKIDR